MKSEKKFRVPHTRKGRYIQVDTPLDSLQFEASSDEIPFPNPVFNDFSKFDAAGLCEHLLRGESESVRAYVDIARDARRIQLAAANGKGQGYKQVRDNTKALVAKCARELRRLGLPAREISIMILRDDVAIEHRTRPPVEILADQCAEPHHRSLAGAVELNLREVLYELGKWPKKTSGRVQELVHKAITGAYFAGRLQVAPHERNARHGQRSMLGAKTVGKKRRQGSLSEWLDRNANESEMPSKIIGRLRRDKPDCLYQKSPDGRIIEGEKGKPVERDLENIRKAIRSWKNSKGAKP